MADKSKVLRATLCDLKFTWPSISWYDAFSVDLFWRVEETSVLINVRVDRDDVTFSTFDGQRQTTGTMTWDDFRQLAAWFLYTYDTLHHEHE